MLEQEKSVRNLLPKEEGVAETMYYEITAVPILIPVKYWRSNLGVELSPWRSEGAEGMWFKTCFYTSLNYSGLIVNKFI